MISTASMSARPWVVRNVSWDAVPSAVGSGSAASPPLVGSAGATGDFTACTAYPGRVEVHRPRLWGGVPVVTQPTEFTPFSPCYKAVNRVFDF